MNLMLSLYRLFQKKKGYYLTHIMGITVGLAAMGFTVIYLEHELTYDSDHRDASRIYRVSYQNNSGWFASLAIPFSNSLKEGSIGEIECLVRMRRWPAKFMYVGEKKFFDQKVLFTDPGSEFFEFFNSFPLLEGDPSTALRSPNSVIISSSTATKYFGKDLAVGQTLRFDTLMVTVTGVFLDLPSNTHLDFDLMITNSRAMDMASGHFTYARIRPGVVPEEIESKILALPVETNEFQKPRAMKLINLPDLHFEGTMTYESKPPGNVSYLVILGAVGLTILLISITNYLNLSVALYAYRSKEIAVRKAVGASTLSMSRQFLIESVIVIAAGLFLAVGVIYLLLPAFNDLLQLRISNPLSSVFMIAMTASTMIIALLAAVYPAFILPRIKILDLFKNSGITNHHGLQLRQVLLSVQFVVLFFVCCSLWIIHNQFTYMQNKDLGFTSQGVIKIKRVWSIDSGKYALLKTELKKNKDILFVSEGYAPGDEDYGFQFRGENSTENEENLLIHNTDYEYLDVLDIKVLEGPILEKNTDALPNKLIMVNQALARQLGYDHPIGRTVTLYSMKERKQEYTIGGVVEDYNFQSLHKTIGPQMLVLNKRSKYVDENIILKVSTSDLESTLDFIRRKVAELAPDVPAVISFLDEDLEKLYRQEIRLNKAVQILTMISVLLSFTGLIALCSYMIGHRLKEIAVRKVMGAEVWNIVSLFAKVFVRIIVISFVAGSVFAYVLMNAWINEFAYHTTISGNVFAMTFALILLTTLLLASWQSVKAARLNPASILKED